MRNHYMENIKMDYFYYWRLFGYYSGNSLENVYEKPAKTRNKETTRHLESQFSHNWIDSCRLIIAVYRRLKFCGCITRMSRIRSKNLPPTVLQSCQLFRGHLSRYLMQIRNLQWREWSLNKKNGEKMEDCFGMRLWRWKQIDCPFDFSILETHIENCNG